MLAEGPEGVERRTLHRAVNKDRGGAGVYLLQQTH
jgi:hypothetical protein